MVNFATLSRSLHLLKLSFRIIAKNKKLLVFPAVSFFFSALIFLIFFAPALLEPTGHSWGVVKQWETLSHRFSAVLRPWAAGDQTILQYWKIITLYFLSVFFATFGNVALYREILKAMAGDPVSVRGGLLFACRRIRAILFWSLFASSVGMLIRLLSEKLGFVGKFAVSLVGFAWSVAAIFVIPTMIREENSNPVHLLSTSAAMVKKTWGEYLIGYVSIQLMPLLIVLMLVPTFIGLALPSPESLIAIGAVWIVAFVGFTMLLSMANSVFRCALYIYASESVVPEPFTPEMLDAAWTVKKN